MDYDKLKYNFSGTGIKDALRQLQSPFEGGRTAEQERSALRKRGVAIQELFETDSEKSWLSEYQQARDACIEAYIAVERLRPEYRQKSVVQELYFQRDKLRDYLEQLVAFAEAECRPTDTAEKLAVKGYSNYLFVIKCTMESLKNHYEGASAETPAEECSVRSFLRKESTGQPVLEHWQQNRKQLAAIMKAPQVDRKACANVMAELDMLELTFKKEIDNIVEFLRNKAVALQNRHAVMLSGIRQSEALYRDLTGLLTEAVYLHFDPDASAIETWTVEQVKTQYRKLASIVRQLLQAYPR